MLNIITIQGRFTKDAEIVTTSGGVKLCRFAIACQRSRKEKDGTRASDFIDCVAFGNTADFIGKYFHKGDMAIVDGSLETNTYTNKDGNNVKGYTVIVNGVNFVGGPTKNETTAPASTSDSGLPFEV